MTIKNVTDLRDFAIETLESLRKDEISIQNAATRAKLVDNIINTVKAELDYNRVTSQDLIIPFMQNEGKLIEMNSPKIKLLSKETPAK